MKYFAYGSNMSLERLQKRCPSAKVLGVASVTKYGFACHKLGIDMSSKADIVWNGNNDSVVYGVVFEISRIDVATLNVCEGAPIHYARKQLKVNMNGKRVKVWAYFAQPDYIMHENVLRPLFSYMKHIITGAEENNLPAAYIQKLKEIKVQPKRKLVDGKAIVPSVKQIETQGRYWQ